MKYVLISLLVLGIGCKEVNNNTTNNPKPDTPASDSSQDNLEGLYMLPDGGSLELIQLENGSYYIYGTQRVVSENNDGSLSLHPNLPTTQLLMTNNELFGIYSATYVSATHNIKRNSDNALIVGARNTQYRIKFGSDGKLNIEIKIYATNGIDVETTRLVAEE